jgi:hypothetical protein
MRLLIAKFLGATWLKAKENVGCFAPGEPDDNLASPLNNRQFVSITFNPKKLTP